MYHTMFPPQMMVQIMGGQQVSGQCPPSQTHSVHINGINTLHQPEYAQYVPDVSGHNRHHLMQTGSHPLELLQLMGAEIPSIRWIDYMHINGGSSSPNWHRRINSSNSAPTIPSAHLSFRQTSTSLLRKLNWNNKGVRRTSYRDSYTHNEKYNSDSGFSSRSPTPNKHQADSSQNESSDERDSVISSTDHGMKKPYKVHSDYSMPSNKSFETGLFSSASPHQFYPHQRSVNYYHSAVATPRSQVQNYQGKRRYHSGRNSPPLQKNQRGRKYPGNIGSRHVFPRYDFESERFLPKSQFVEISRMPQDLITGASRDLLSNEIWSKFIANQQSKVVYRNKMLLWKYLSVFIKTAFPKYGLFLVGSTLNGFGSDSSDVDMCLIVRHTEMDQRNEAIGHLAQVLKCLRRCDFVEQLELIQAKVPILKFRDTLQHLEVDLNCNNAVGIRNTHLLYCYSRIDWRVRPLVLVIKLWAQSQGINDAKRMTISSYSLVLMVIHFLQSGACPRVLPCLHSFYPKRFNSYVDINDIDINEELNSHISVLQPANQQSLGELFIDFFRYYVTFDFNQYAISVRLGTKIPIDNCRRARSYKNDPHQWKCLCIEEPFDLTNTARSVYDPDVFARIKQVFDRTYKRLKENHNLAGIFIKL